ncbi:MAG: 3-hydroxyacyl-CoA dehydrogenase NAD-binding domain-containing protein, partial [Alphaproteobacteria bacterium]
MIAVIGNGIIGHGIAEIFAGAGWQVRLIGRGSASLAAAIGKIRASLQSFAAHGLMTAEQCDGALARIRTTTRLEDAAEAEFVIEAVPEDMALKRSIFARLDALCGAEVVLASSSGHLASELVAGVRHRGRVIATHFWYPPQLIPLVEVCAGPETA